MDTEALTITGLPWYQAGFAWKDNLAEAIANGNVRSFFVADAQYPNGYRTNVPGDLSRMNTVTDTDPDLHYFTSLDALQGAGYTCVGILTEYRDVTIPAGSDGQIYIPVHVSDDPELIGRTYCTVNSVRAWNDHSVDDVSYAIDESAKEIKALYNLNNKTRPYIKAEYDNGQLAEGTDNPGYLYGMSLLLLGYESRVRITNNGHAIYDVDRGGRRADFTITDIGTTVNSENSGQGDVHTPALTELEIDLSVDSKLKIDKDSFEIDGMPISSNPDAPTTVSYTYDGQEYTYTIYVVTDPDDDHNATFYLQGVLVGADLKDIDFIADIGNPGGEDDVVNEEVLQVTAKISGTSDKRSYSTVHGNMSQDSITIVKLSAASLYKSIDHSKLEIEEGFTFTISYKNEDQRDFGNIKLYDILPYNGDSRGTSFHGSYKVEEIKAELSSTHDADKDVSIYVSGEQNVTWQEYDTVFGSSVATGAGSAVYVPEDSSDLNSIGVSLSGLSAGGKLTIDIKIAPDDNQPMDYYANDSHAWITTYSPDSALNSNVVSARVITRSISGLEWFDVNQNNVRDPRNRSAVNTEDAIAGRTVTLLRLKENGDAAEPADYEAVAETTTGHAYDVYHDSADGETTGNLYEFNTVFPGIYAIRFQANEYRPCEPHVGGNDRIDSDAVWDGDDGTYEYAYILNILMPEKDDMTGYVYSSANNDFGYHGKNLKVLKIWVDENDRTGLRPGSIVIQSDAAEDEATISKDDNWEYKYVNLPVYAGGDGIYDSSSEISYTVSEVSEIEEYTSAVSEPEKDTEDENTDVVTITNTIKTGKLNLHKIVEGDLAQADPDTEFTFEITLSAGKDKIPVSGLFSAVRTAGDAETSETVTFDEDGKAEVKLHADETLQISQIPAGTDYSVTEQDLPEQYLLLSPEEGTASGTITSQEVSEVEFVNYYEALTTVSVTKVWSDADEQDGARPEAVTVNLLADGEQALDPEGKPVTAQLQPDGDGNWPTYVFEGLPKYKTGTNETIEYTVQEDGEEDGKVNFNGILYEVTVSGSAQDGFTITNTHEPELIDIEGEKIWDDGNNQDGIRPQYVKINLFADNEPALDENGKEMVQIVTPDEAGMWKYSFTGLPKYRDQGTEIVYSVTEDKVKGYETQIDGFTITNKHYPAVVDIYGEKFWDDNNNQDGKRPGSITIHLVANGNIITSMVLDLSDGEPYKFAFVNLPKYENGQRIYYHITEEAVAGYTTQIAYERIEKPNNNTEVEVTITNQYTPKETSVTVTKYWDDEDDRYQIRPESITVELYEKIGDDPDEEGKKIDEKVLTEKESWSWTFGNLPMYRKGKLINYSVKEVAVDGYTTDVNGNMIEGYRITNTAERTKISVKKVWDDANDQDGIRPESLIVYLTADGERTGDILVLNASNAWSGSFENLIKYKADSADGEMTTAESEAGLTEIEYGVEEEEIDGYTVSGPEKDEDTNTFTFTNTHEPELIEVVVRKNWLGDEKDPLWTNRPEEIIVNLLADGSLVDWASISPSDPLDVWSWTFSELPKYADGKEIQYSVTENAIKDYTQTGISGVKGTNVWHFDLENTYAVGETSVTATKVWDDDDDRDGLRQDVVFMLYQEIEGEEPVPVEGSEKTISKDATGADLTVIWDHLPIKVYGKEITYTVRELAASEPSQPEAKSLKRVPPVKPQDNGTSVQEEEVIPGYVTTISGNMETGFTITNRHEPETVELEIYKLWEDGLDHDKLRPKTLQVQLLADGVWKQNYVLRSETGWQLLVRDLPRYSKKGMEIVYEIREPEVFGYDSEVEEITLSSSRPDGEQYVIYAFNLTNTHDPEPVSVELKGTKTLTGRKLKDDEFSFDLLDEDGEIVETVVNQNGKIRFSKITYTETGVYNYTIREAKPETPEEYVTYDDTVYEVTVEVILSADGKKLEAKITGLNVDGSGADFKNEFIPPKTSVTVVKQWKDGNNQDGIRPDHVNVFLTRDGERVGKAVTLNAGNGWTYTWEDLDVYSFDEEGNKTLLVYDVEEDLAEDSGYTLKKEEETPSSEAAGDAADETAADNEAGKQVVLVNEHEPETITISGTKTWEDENNQDGVRPASITLYLYADGALAETKTISAPKDAADSAEWSYEFTGLPKYDQGRIIQYTVLEKAVSGYTMSVNGYDITNTRTPEKTFVTVIKRWEDKSNVKNLRPENITVRLYADGKEVQTGVLSAAEGWYKVFTGLDAKKNGKAIVYTVTEDSVEGYITTITGNAETGYIINNKLRNPKVKETEKKSYRSGGTPPAGGSPAPGGKNVSSVKTGDDTPLLMYLILLAAALAAIGGCGYMIVRKRRRNL